MNYSLTSKNNKYETFVYLAWEVSLKGFYATSVNNINACGCNSPLI